MNTAQKLLNQKKIKEQIRCEQRVDEIIKEIILSIEDGYDGKVFDFHLNPLEERLLREHGFRTKTFTDGEFEECSVWIE